MSLLFFNTFGLSLIGNINILIVQHAFMFVLNNALKRFDDTPQSKSKAAAKWIVIKIRDLNKSSTYIYFMCVYTNCS